MKRLYEDPSGKLTTLTKMDTGCCAARPPARGPRAELRHRGSARGRGWHVHGGQLRLAARRLGAPRMVAGWLRRAGDLRHAERVPVNPAQPPSASGKAGISRRGAGRPGHVSGAPWGAATARAPAASAPAPFRCRSRGIRTGEGRGRRGMTGSASAPRARSAGTARPPATPRPPGYSRPRG